VLVLSPEDGGSMFLWNVGIYLQVYTALQPTRPTLTCRPFKILEGYKKHESHRNFCMHIWYNNSFKSSWKYLHKCTWICL
jgi:hypothetical protein